MQDPSLLCHIQSIALTWQELNKQRLAWALRAYKRFVDTLSPEVRERLAHGSANGEAYVAVFGKTQVGKTTLLLDLMGLTPEAMLRVSKVLRGKREHGCSATATAMEYRRSPDNHWYLGSGSDNREITDDSAMEQALADIRQQMSMRKLKNTDEPIVVWIPSECFLSSSPTTTQVRILDLPGDNAADAIEREHVYSMTKRYLPHADIVLLVGRINDLGFLRPDSLNLPSIEDWQIVPERFRIVTTYSFTADSMREQAHRNLTQLSADFFQKRLLEQIETFGLELSNDSRQLHRYFPLEFGDSWSNMEASLSDLKERVDPINSDLKKKLIKDIHDSATETSRLHNAVDVHVVVRRVKENRLRKMDEELSCIKESLDKVKKIREIAANTASRASSDREEKESLLHSIQNKIDEIRQDVRNMGKIDIQEELMSIDEIEESVKALQYRIVTFSDFLKNKAFYLRPSIVNEIKNEDFPKKEVKSIGLVFGSVINLWGNKDKDSLASKPIDGSFLPAHNVEESTLKENFWKPVRSSLDRRRIEDHISQEFSALNKRLHGYWVDWYAFDNCSKDKEMLRESMLGAAKKVGEGVVDAWMPLLDKRMASIKKEADDACSFAKARQIELDEVSSELRRKEAEIERHESERSLFIEKMNADKERAETFIRFLDEEYEMEMENKRRVITEENNPALSFMQILSAVQIIEARAEIMVKAQ